MVVRCTEIDVKGHVNLNYRLPCRQGDRLRIVTWPQRRGRSSFVSGQRIEREGVVVADALVTLVTTDPATGRGRPLPEGFGDLFMA